MKRWTKWGTAALFAATTMGAPFAAHAGPDPSVDDPAARDAMERFREGLKRYEASDFEGARVAFLQAYSVLRALDILYNLSLAELRSDRPVEALHHLQELLRDSRSTELERSRASKYLAEAHSKTGHVFVEAPRGAAIAMDDVTLDRKAPLHDPIDVTVGKHVCTVRFAEKTQTVEVIAQPGQSVTVRFFSGQEQPEVMEGGRERHGEGEHGQREKETDRRWSGAKVTTVVLLGTAAVAALGGGALFKIAQDDKRNQAQALSARYPNPPSCAVDGTCAEMNDLRNSYDTDRTLSVVFFGAGAVLGASAIGAALLWPNAKAEPHEERRPRIAPSVSARGASLMVSGEF